VNEANNTPADAERAEQMQTAANDETKHTPGSWFLSTETQFVEGVTIYENKSVEVPTFPCGVLSSHRYGEGDPEQICYIGGDLMSPEDEAENIANARLIAAAPDMLAALKGIAAHAEEELNDLAADVQEGGKFNHAAHERWSRVLSAIAKATAR
jgi:hypothetical protein